MSASHKDFGAELILDLHGCDPEIIRSRKKLETFVRRLVRRIKMKAFGEPFLEHFGHKDPVTSGYSLVQLIETSSITAHFSEGKNSVYMNIFSCKSFDREDCKKFCMEYFKAKRVHNRYFVRK